VRKASERTGHSAQHISKSESGGPRNLQEKSLGPREREVVILLAEGNTNKQIAAILNLSSRTVESYRASVMRKLKMRSFPELIRYALRHGIVKADVLERPTPLNVVRDGSPPIELSDPCLYALKMSDEFKELQSSFKALQRRFERAKTSKEKRELLVSAGEIVLRAHLLTAELRARALAPDSQK
jgi:DNA-binding CsgD family transcriptional regulator